MQRQPDVDEDSVRSKTVLRARKEEEEGVQKESIRPETNSSGQSGVSSDIESTIQGSKGSGQSLHEGVLDFFEPRFGADFSRVKIHTDTTSSQLARQLHAQAFTVGANIYFGAGHYNPQTTQGKQLIGHELTHVVQQGGASSLQAKPYPEKDSALFRPEITGKKSAIPDLQCGFWDDPWGSITSAGRRVWNGIRSVGRGIGRGARSSWNWIKDIGRATGRGILSAWDWIQDVGRTLGGGVFTAWNWIRRVGHAVGQGILNAWEWIQGVGRVIGRGVGAAWEWIQQVARRIGRSVLSAWNWIKGLAGRIGRTLLQAWEWLQSIGGIAWKCIKGLVFGAGSSEVQRKPAENGNREHTKSLQRRTTVRGKPNASPLAMRHLSIGKKGVTHPFIQRYSEDIHYYKTLEDALHVGYGPVQADTVAFEDQAVDTGWRHPWITTPTEMLNPRVSGKDMLHFAARGVAVNDMQKAIEACDLKAFGAGLHRFQDTFSHNFTTWKTPVRRICAAWCWKINPLLAAAILVPNPAYGRAAALKHACLGFYPDEHHPEQMGRDATMRNMTRSWLTHFLTECPHRAALKFTSASFNQGTGGALTVTPGAKSVSIESSAYSPSGAAKVEGGADALAKDWEAGFIQTAHRSVRKAHYIGSKKHTMRKDFVPGAARDALVAGKAPWYDPDNTNGPGRKKFKTTNSTLNVSLWDRPNAPAPWKTPDKKGKLSHHDGKDVFTAWMITRKKTPKNHIEFLNWTSWKVDYRVTFNYAATGKKTVKNVIGSTTNTGSGKGQGKASPVLGGTTANDAATVVWS